MQELKGKKILQKVQETYNDISKEFSDTRAFAGKEFEVILPYLQPGQKWVDLGCGNGRLLNFLEKETASWNVKALDYTGIDNSHNLLLQARQKHPGHEFKDGDMLNIPLKDHSTDVLFCIRAFHHLPTVQMRIAALKEMKRVLKPGGILMLTVWNLWQKRYWKEHIKALFSKNLWIPWGKEKKLRYYHAFTYRELKKLSLKCGFEILDLHKTNPQTKAHDYVLIAKT